jgi:hypothetical protein
LGQAFDLNGTSAYVQVGNSASMDFGTGDFSISLWVKFNAIGGETTLLQKSVGAYPMDQTYQLEAFPDSVRFIIRNTTAAENDYTASKVLSVGQFHQIAAVRKGAMLSVYTDGALTGSQDGPPGIDTGAGGMSTLGRLTPEAGQAFDRYLNGLLDEIQLYDRALTADEVRSLFDDFGAGSCSG